MDFAVDQLAAATGLVAATLTTLGVIVTARQARERIEDSQRASTEALWKLLSLSTSSPDVLGGTLTRGSGDAASEQPEPEPTPSQIEVKDILARYAEDLEAEATRIAKRAGADEASVKHIRVAADRIGILREKFSNRVDASLSAGAFLAGAGLSYLVNIATGGKVQSLTVAWIFGALAVVGLIVYSVALTIRIVKN